MAATSVFPARQRPTAYGLMNSCTINWPTADHSRGLCLLDENTRECLAIEVGKSLRSQDVCLQLQDEGRAHDAEATHQFPAHLDQGSNPMLDAGRRRGDRAVARFLRLANVFGGMASWLDVQAPAGLLQSGFLFDAGLATVGIHVATSAARIEQFFKKVDSIYIL